MKSLDVIRLSEGGQMDPGVAAALVLLVPQEPMALAQLIDFKEFIEFIECTECTVGI